MTKMKWSVFAVLLLFAFASYLAVAQDNRTPEQRSVQSEPEAPPAEIVRHRGTVITPPISDSHRQGVHTNYKIFIPEGQKGPAAAIASTVFQFAETPASIACLYKIGANFTGCNPTAGHAGGGIGGWGAIAVVDAYDHPFVASDLTTFESAFGLPAANFTKVIANTAQCALLGGCPFAGLTPSCAGTPANANLFGWDVEIDLDTQYASAMAPSAHTYLVEACTQGLEDLLFAEEVAGALVAGAGGGDISNSWGYPEACAQSSSCNGGWPDTIFQDDNYFYRYFWNHITYFASAGDSPGDIIYPSTSPWVVSAGGTTINRSSAGNFVNESCWADSGGGPSAVENYANPPSISAGLGAWTNYQYDLFGGYPYENPFRSTPDIAADADPASGVVVYVGDEGSSNGFYVVGGTSVASPILAGIVNVSNNRLGQGTHFYGAQELELIYSQLFTNLAYKANWYDVKIGNNSHPAGPGYDQCTGIGSPRGKNGK